MSNGFEEHLSLDRVDNSGPYAPWNCRWADRATQNRNTRRNRLVTVCGKTQTIMDWAKEKGVRESEFQQTIKRRMGCRKSSQLASRPDK